MTSCIGVSPAGFSISGTSGDKDVQQSISGLYTYTITCTGPKGSLTRSLQIKVIPKADVTVTQVAPFFLANGMVPSRITWNGSTFTNCTGRGFNTGGAVSGTISYIELDPNVQISMICRKNSNSPDITGSFTPTPSPSGGSALLSYSSPTADICNEGIYSYGKNWNSYNVVGGSGKVVSCWRGGDYSALGFLRNNYPVFLSYTGANISTSLVKLDWDVTSSISVCRVNNGSAIVFANGLGTTTINRVPTNTYKLECVGGGGYRSSTIITP